MARGESKPKPSPEPRRSALRGKIPLLYCVGSILLFGSWICQNQFEQGWRRQRDDLDNLQFRASANEQMANTWFSTLLQLQAADASAADRSSAALQYVAFMGNVFSASMSAGETDEAVRNNIGRNREAYLQDTLKAHQARDYEHVLANADRMRKSEEAVSRVISVGNLNRRNALQAAEDTWNFWFRALFVAGSILLAMTFLRDAYINRAA